MSFAKLKEKYLAWARSQVDDEKVETLAFDELGFPNAGWDEIEREFIKHIEARSFSTLDAADLDALLYLIARTWDAGRFIAWIGNSGHISNLGTMSPSDALFLAEAASQKQGRDYEDAKYQFAAVLPQVSISDPNVHRILLDLFNTGESFTRRLALTSLAKIGHPQTKQLLEKLWQSGDEFARITCLNIIEQELGDDTLLDQYLALAESLPGDQLAQNRADAMVRRSVRPPKL